MSVLLSDCRPAPAGKQAAPAAIRGDARSFPALNPRPAPKGAARKSQARPRVGLSIQHERPPEASGRALRFPGGRAKLLRSRLVPGSAGAASDLPERSPHRAVLLVRRSAADFPGRVRLCPGTGRATMETDQFARLLSGTEDLHAARDFRACGRSPQWGCSDSPRSRRTGRTAGPAFSSHLSLVSFLGPGVRGTAPGRWSAGADPHEGASGGEGAR